MNIEQARNLSLDSFIKQLGHQEVSKGNSNEAWFRSPLREEKTASFKVDRRTNKWIDFGRDNQQYDIIDFVKAYAERRGWGTLNTSEALQRIASISGEQPRISRSSAPQPNFGMKGEGRREENRNSEVFRIDHIGPVRSMKLIDYLRERKLQVGPAKDYLQQIHYTHTPSNRQFYGLTWVNEVGGQEVRSPYFKTIIGSKAPSVLEVKHPKAVTGTAIFEGMTDYLSYLQLAKREVMNRAIIMNSTATYKRVIELATDRSAGEPVQGYLQNDRAGLAAAVHLRRGIPELQLQNRKYSAYGDLNDYLTGKPLMMEDKKYAQKVLESELKEETFSMAPKLSKGKSIG